MYAKLEIFQVAHGLATHASARQSAIAANVANADTPGYRAKDVKPFSETYRAPADETALRQTRAKHIMGTSAAAIPAEVIDRAGPSSPNGNTVSLETEMMHATEVKHAHDLALSVYQTSLNILRTSLGRGR